MGSVRSRWTWVIWGILSTVPAAKVLCREEKERRSCPSSSTPPTNTPLGAMPVRYLYPDAAAESTSLVQEVLRPFSLRDFAENYWEKKPLVIRGRSPNHYERLVKFGLNDVESVIENGVALAGAGEDPMVLGSDWNIIKRVFLPSDGEFWTAALPPSAASSSSSSSPSEGSRNSARPEHAAGGAKGQGGEEKRVVSLPEAHRAFHRGGFSLVINRLQRRWRGVWGVARALEDVLGHPVNANMYMTPPESQGFEAHFDWMDGFVVQLVGSKTWILYDELLPFPRADLKYKPAAADLGEPIAVLELRPGDLMYIPRGWPHEAAVNGTAGAGRQDQAGTSPPSGGRGGSAGGPSMHVTFGVESAVSGTYESLLHHALEVAAVDHPHLFGLSPQRGEGEANSDDGTNAETGVRQETELPWLQLLHVWVHDVASRDSRLRRAVPLVPMFFPPAPPTTAATKDGSGEEDRGDKNTREEAVCTEEEAYGRQEAAAAAASSAVLREFQLALEACTRTGGAAPRTLALLESLLKEDALKRVQDMFALHKGAGPHNDGNADVAGDEMRRGGGAAAVAATGDAFEEAGLSRPMLELEKEWARAVFEAFDRDSLASSLIGDKIDGFRKVASPEGGLRRMVLAATRRAQYRAAITEQDLARCGQGSSLRELE